ncbi:hypothetical protein Bca52824_095923 [Brassica carinata]|uniref:Uncharacterized protein n=1 Tax=Brassica carinata TaxID=52824 RepID=A0A8X7THU0_BRACI|nr:hypothetical protein Bca52824_095923 [Brassica carinata]
MENACVIRYITLVTADSGILHSTVAWLSGLSFTCLDHLNFTLKSSSSYTGTHFLRHAASPPQRKIPPSSGRYVDIPTKTSR